MRRLATLLLSAAAPFAVLSAAAPAALAAPAAPAVHAAPAVGGTKWESDQICGGVLNPTQCYLTFNAHTNFWFVSINGPTPLTRARHHCNRAGWCEEIPPNGQCMTISSTVRGKRQVIDRRCAGKASQLWKISNYSNGASSFEVYSLVHDSGCKWRGKRYQYVLTSTGDNHKVSMQAPEARTCGLSDNQLWFKKS